jgi:ribonuclease HII
MLKKYHTKNILEVGIDEAGRGCLFGPVCIGAVILKDSDDPLMNEIKDSKKLSEKKKNILFDFIKNNSIAYSVQFMNHEEIDRDNILQTTLNGMHKCLDEIDEKVNIENILVDGNHFPPYFSSKQDKFLKHNCIINGDNEYLNIAAASILAKVSRDNYIKDLCEKNEIYNKYHLAKNKGYGTKQHLDAIKEFGITDLHRKSFAPCKKYI